MTPAAPQPVERSEESCLPDRLPNRRYARATELASAVVQLLARLIRSSIVDPAKARYSFASLSRMIRYSAMKSSI